MASRKAGDPTPAQLRSGLTYVPNHVPKFLQKMYAETGHKTDEESVQSKFREDVKARELEDREDKDDEAPQIVVLKTDDVDGDEAASIIQRGGKMLGKEEVKSLKRKQKQKQNYEASGDVVDGAWNRIIYVRATVSQNFQDGEMKPMFKKPGTNKDLPPASQSGVNAKGQKSNDKKQVKNKALLSFDDDEEA
jgi:hypothetical protein